MSDRFSSVEKAQRETFDEDLGIVRRPSLFRQYSSASSSTPLLTHRGSDYELPLRHPFHGSSSSSSDGTISNVEQVELEGLKDDLGKRHIGPELGGSSTPHVCHLHPTGPSTHLLVPYLFAFRVAYARLRNRLGRLADRKGKAVERDDRLEAVSLERGCECPSTDEKQSNKHRTDRPDGTIDDPVRGFRNRGVWIMIGALITLVLIFYAWNVEVLWGGEMMRGRHHDYDHGLNKTGRVLRHMVHSHNDEMQGDNALIWSLSLGVGSIEVDIWLSPTPPAVSSAVVSPSSRRAARRSMRETIKLGSIGSEETLVDAAVDKRLDVLDARSLDLEEKAPIPDPGMTLLTGHEVKDISKRTLVGQYLDPLLARLEDSNRHRKANDSAIGLYADDPTAEVQLVIDMKSDGDMTWPYLIAALKPLLDGGYLTTYDTTTQTWNRSAILVIGTGNTPVHRVYHQSRRVVFYDAPLKTLSQTVRIPATDAGPATQFEWDNTISPMASSKFPIPYHVALALPPWNPIATRLRYYTLEASRRGIASRWWGSARKPGWARRRMWEVQKQGGVDWINADDLADAVDWVDGWDSR